jgi:hypothetical protein
LDIGPVAREGPVARAGATGTIDIEEDRADLEQLIDELKPGEGFAISAGEIPQVKAHRSTSDELEKLTANEG